MFFLTNKNHAMEIFSEPPKYNAIENHVMENHVRRGLAVLLQFILWFVCDIFYTDT